MKSFKDTLLTESKGKKAVAGYISDHPELQSMMIERIEKFIEDLIELADHELTMEDHDRVLNMKDVSAAVTEYVIKELK